jgi:hypothetical protein
VRADPPGRQSSTAADVIPRHPPAVLVADGDSYIPETVLPEGVTDRYDHATVPVYVGQEGVEDAYRRAERDDTPFFGVEEYEDGYAVTYDLLPAGHRLAPTADKEARTRLTQEVESIVADETLPTTEVSKSVNDSLANVSLFERERSARRVAAAVAPVVLDEANWIPADA